MATRTKSISDTKSVSGLADTFPVLRTIRAQGSSVGTTDGGVRRLFQARYALSTAGSFLRSVTCGHFRQLDAIDSRFW